MKNFKVKERIKKVTSRSTAILFFKKATPHQVYSKHEETTYLARQLNLPLWHA